MTGEQKDVGYGKDRRYRDKEFLQREYWENSKTIRQIADMCNVSKSVISEWMQRHDISTRDGKKMNPLRNGLKSYTRYILYFLAELALDGRRHVSSRETRNIISSMGERSYAFQQLHRLGVIQEDNLNNGQWIIDKQKILEHVPICPSCNRILTRDIHKLHNPKYTERYKDKDICTDCWPHRHTEDIERIQQEPWKDGDHVETMETMEKP